MYFWKIFEVLRNFYQDFIKIVFWRILLLFRRQLEIKKYWEN